MYYIDSIQSLFIKKKNNKNESNLIFHISFRI